MYYLHSPIEDRLPQVGNVDNYTSGFFGGRFELELVANSIFNQSDGDCI
jgi:hypothetical protein